MKKITKKLVSLALTAGLALTVGVGVANVYESYNDTTITASAEATKIDVTNSIQMRDYGTTGDYPDTPLYRITLTENDSNAFEFGNFCANEYGGEMLKWIKINGKSIYDHRAEYQAAVKAGERAPVTSKQGNIGNNQTADNIYAPIFVCLIQHSVLSSKCIDIYIPNDYMTKDQVKTIEITADFTTNFASEKKGTTPTETCYLSKSVTWTDINNQRMGKWVEGAMEKSEVTVKAPFVKVTEATNFFGTELIGSDYTGSGANNVAPGFNKALLDSLNFWDYVEFDGVKLTTMITDTHIPGEVGLNVWGAQSALCFRFPAFTPDYLNGLTEIKYLAGCKFPSFTNPTGAYYELKEDAIFVKYNDAWINIKQLKKAEDVTFGGGYIDGEAKELVKFEFKIADCNMFTADNDDASNWVYGGGTHARSHILLNGKSLYEIAKTVDDSGYVYTGLMAKGEQNEDGLDRFSNPTLLFGNHKDTNDLMQVWVHKDYLATLGDEVTLTIATGFQNWHKDTTLTEDVSQTYYRYADGSYGMTKMEKVATDLASVSTTIHSHNFITFTLADLDVPAEVTDLQIITIENAAKYSKTNFMNYVYINGKPMSEMVPGEVIYNLGGSKTISVRIRTFGNEGDADFDKNVFTSKIETIEIKAGCQFPAYSYAVAGGAVKAYTIDEDIRLVYEDGEWTTPYNPVSIPEANAAEDGTKVEVSGTVAEVNTAWSTKFNNMTVTLVDAEGNELYVYRLGTQVTLGDVITVKGKMGSYNGNKQVAQGSKAVVTGHDDKYAYAEMTAAEAIAAAKGTAVSVTGTVVEIGTAYADKNDNISVYVVDEAGTKIYVYRLSGNVEVGQLIKVSGVMDEYKGAVQVVSGSYEALGMHECSNFTDGKCIVCGADEPIPEYVEVYLQPGENTITMAAGQYAMAYMRGAGKFTFTWTGEATIMAGRMPIANGGVVEYNPMMGAFTILPTNAEAECTVVLTVAEYEEPVVEVQLGANAITVPVENNYCAGVVVQFTATEAGEYVIKPAEGETNADITVIGEVTEWIEEYPYTFTMEAGATIQFLVCTSNVMLTEDTIDFVIEVAADEPIDPPTSEDPIDPPTSEPTTSEPTTSEPTTSEPTTSEPTTSEPEEEKKGGCGSVIGGVSAALTLIAAAAMVMKKKED